jgi:hypothetical protein
MNYLNFYENNYQNYFKYAFYHDFLNVYYFHLIDNILHPNLHFLIINFPNFLLIKNHLLCDLNFPLITHLSNPLFMLLYIHFNKQFFKKLKFTFLLTLIVFSILIRIITTIIF